MPPLDLYPAYLIYIFKRAWCGGAVLILHCKGMTILNKKRTPASI